MKVRLLVHLLVVLVGAAAGWLVVRRLPAKPVPLPHADLADPASGPLVIVGRDPALQHLGWGSLLNSRSPGPPGITAERLGFGTAERAAQAEIQKAYRAGLFGMIDRHGTLEHANTDEVAVRFPDLGEACADLSAAIEALWIDSCGAERGALFAAVGGDSATGPFGCFHTFSGCMVRVSKDAEKPSCYQLTIERPGDKGRPWKSRLSDPDHPLARLAARHFSTGEDQ